MSASVKPSRQRKAVVPPQAVSAEMSVFDYLRNCQPPLDKKIIDIACSQTNVPGDLKHDAAQEIVLMWSQMKPDTEKYKPGQIAAYAHQMARHAALRLRREIGASVRLPGSAFRKRKDGTSYVSPGVLAAALDWNELEGWFQADDLSEMGISAQAMGFDFEAVAQAAEDDNQTVVSVDEDEALRQCRLETLESRAEALSPRQLEIVRALVEGATYEEVMEEQGIKKGVLMRELAIASSVIGPFEF